MQSIKESFRYGKHEVTLETGRIAKQAAASVFVTMGDTAVLVAVAASKKAQAQQSFFPLTVNYQERTYSAGKVPGGFFKREGRPSEKETLVSRMIDRPLRPLFPDEFFNEVQVTATVMSLDPEVNPDIPAMLGAAAAVELSGLPYNGPIAAARVGFINGENVLNPPCGEMGESLLDLVIAGTEDAVLMVESAARMLNEKQMLSAIVFGHKEIKNAIAAIRSLASQAQVTKWDWEPPQQNAELKSQVESKYASDIAAAYRIVDKQERVSRIDELRTAAIAEFVNEDSEPPVTEDCVGEIFSKIAKNSVRAQILNSENRIDGRDTRSVRPITSEIKVLPRVHGSALFTRGETQAMVTATLGTERDAQIIDAIEGERRDRFMLHYNFPPYCVGETGFMGGPKRREIGHGNLAKRALMAVMPDEQGFPYVVRVVSEITESNGSSSMATVCGATMSLLDAGVPLQSPVAGIAMGLILEGGKFAILTDILGDEDHLGDMDFKVAGTRDGITALQMDVKLTEGLNYDVMLSALEQAKEGRLHILDEIEKVIKAPGELSPHAPRLSTIQIKVNKIRDVIGKGGATIRALTEETGTTIDIDDNGVVTIAASDQEASDEVRRRIEELTADAEIGKIYTGTVNKIMDFGAFVTILPGRDGLVHISQVSEEHVKDMDSVVKEGETVRVKVIDIDRQGRIRLSMKEVQDGDGE